MKKVFKKLYLNNCIIDNVQNISLSIFILYFLVRLFLSITFKI